MITAPVDNAVRSELVGPIRRTLYIAPDGRRDVTSDVVWLQGPSLYVDLRLPAVGPGPYPGGAPPAGPAGPAELGTLPADALCRLAAREGFAGRFLLRGDLARWERIVDVAAPSPTPDEGRLSRHGDVVVEVGVHTAYVEHWRPDPRAAAVDAAGVLLREVGTGRTGVLVRVGSRFGYARGRGRPLPPEADLGALLLAAGPAERAALLDCEVALGTVDERGRWLLTASTLPYRSGHDLALVDDGASLRTGDVCPAGPCTRRWEVVEHEGVTILPDRSRPSRKSGGPDATP